MLLLRLVKRNILVYSRERSNIFYSLLATLIIIGLMAIFLGKMNSDGLVDLLNKYGGVRDAVTDTANANQLIIMWTLAGIVVVNSVTITLAMVGIMVEDEARKRLAGFFVTPVNRGLFVMGYITAAIIMGVIMCSLTVVIGEVYLWATGGVLLTALQLGKILFFIILNVFSSASMVFLLVNFVHSTSAFGGLSTIIGSLVGFLAAIYLPMGMLPAKVQTVLKFFPLLHGCSFMRTIFTEEAVATTFMNSPAKVADGYKEYMGMSISWNGNIIDDRIQVAILLISGIIFIVISAMIQKRRDVISR